MAEPCEHVWEIVEDDPWLEFCSQLSCGITRERDIENCTEVTRLGSFYDEPEFCQNIAYPGEEYCAVHLRGN